MLTETLDPPAATLLELGSGGGNTASHLKDHFRLTLADLSPAMLEVSRALNPECEHLLGDMRSLRVGRVFDRVLIHDAIMLMTTEEDLRQTLATAFAHCRPGGGALFAPDWVRETFGPATEHGGCDRDGRGLRYVEWIREPAPGDTCCRADFALLLREADGSVRVEHDRQVFGLFPRTDWLRLLGEVGFAPRSLPDPFGRELFVGVRPGE